MKMDTRLEDLIGLEDTKLGFFKEVQIKMRELQESNLKLKEKRQQIQAILDGITDVMAVISLDYRIQSVNHVFYKAFPHPEPQDEFCYKVFRNLSSPCSPCPLSEALHTNHVCRQMHIYHLKGENRQFEITASPLRDQRGRPEHMLLLKRDVTVEKEYQAKYYHAEKMATIGLLAAGVAHEINNPLTAICGFAEGLKRRLPRLEEQLGDLQNDQKLARDLQEYVETIIAEGHRCRDIVQNLLTFSPRWNASLTAVDLNFLVVDVLKILEHHLKNKLPNAICLDLGSALPRPMGIAAELKQVVLNLVLNALEAIQNRGNITLRTYTLRDSWIVLSVKDTGYGIPKENLDKLFEPFFTTKPVGKGIGIGLSTCYNIIRQHKGEIQVESSAGQGATFRVKLPMP
jgi:two-component system, NtrC family, sensor kinase